MAIARRDQDLDVILRKAGVLVTLGAASTYGVVHRGGDRLLEDGGVAIGDQAVSVVVHTDTLPGLVPGAAITVNGESLKVSGSMPIKDGRETQIECVKP